MIRFNRRRVIGLILILVLAFAISSFAAKEKSTIYKFAGSVQGRCIRVVDGDTIVVDLGGRRERVRLIGIDTPETVHPQKPVEYFGKEASEFTRRMVEGKEVTLKFDWQQRDKYKRLLAYVYLLDGTFLNAEIVKQGYGFAYTRYPFKYMEEFRRHENEARGKNRGLWRKNEQ
jgi:micrococcal nuclease